MKKIALFLIAIIALVACDGNTPTGTKIETLTLTPNQLELKVGAEKKIRTSVTPATDEIYTVVWKSSDDAVATVDNKGNVVAVAAGNATITATIEGTEISATASVNVVSPFDILKYYSFVLMSMDENGYQIDGIDSNEDGQNDTIYTVTYYGLPESVYLSDQSLVGENDYLLAITTSFSVCSRAAYCLGAYAFATEEEEYLTETTTGGKGFIPHMASCSHFSKDIYYNYYTEAFQQQDFDADAWVEQNGYFMGDYDSFVLYVDWENGSTYGGNIVGGGFETGGTSPITMDITYYSLQLQLFEEVTTLGFKTEMTEDPATGEMVEAFVWPLEWGNIVEKTYTYGEPSSTQPEEVQASVQQYAPVKLDALKKQIAVNNALFTSLKVAFAKK